MVSSQRLRGIHRISTRINTRASLKRVYCCGCASERLREPEVQRRLRSTRRLAKQRVVGRAIVLVAARILWPSHRRVWQVGNVQVVGQDRILNVPEVVTRRWQELFFVHIFTYQCSRTPVNLAKLTC